MLRGNLFYRDNSACFFKSFKALPHTVLNDAYPYQVANVNKLLAQHFSLSLLLLSSKLSLLVDGIPAVSKISLA